VAFLILAVHYFLDPNFNPITGILNEEESRHAIKSLRLNAGDNVLVGDGIGNRYLAAINVIGKKELIVNVISTETFDLHLPKLTIAIAPTKNPSRFEWFLEKATELGVHQIIPISTKRTERPRFKHDRAERIIHAATKQSMRAFMPLFQKLTPLSDVLKTEIELKLIAHCDEDDSKRIEIKDVLKMSSAKEILILIGPEGDFTTDEITLAKENGFQPILLGRNRLRTETAGVFAAATIF